MSLDTIKPKGFYDNPGSRLEIPVVDDNLQSLVLKLVKEMRIMNLHLASITDNYISYEDIENG